MKNNIIKSDRNSNLGFPVYVLVAGLWFFTMNFEVFSQEGLKGIIVEKIPVTSEAASNDPDLPADAIAYRIFAEMAPEYEFQAVFSLENHEMVIETTSEFYNNSDFGGTSAKEIPSALFASYPALVYDSYITVNAAANNKIGILKTEDITDGIVDGLMSGTSLALQTIGEDFSIPFGSDNYAGIFSTFSGIYNVNGGEQGPTSSNRVLIGQFTTNGDFSFELNIQIRKNDGSKLERYVAKNPDVNEYLFAGLTYPVNSAPLVEITSPINGSEFETNDIVTVEAIASDPNGISKVDFYVNENIIAVDSVAPYKFDWTATLGTVRFSAVATDSLGLADTSDVVSITVTNPNVLPDVSITSPLNGASFTSGEVVNVAVDASDEDGTIAQVELFANDVKVSDDATAPYQFEWTAAAGQVNLMAVATDNDGAKDTSSIVTISIATGINDIHDASPEFRVFPNPAKDDLTFEVVGENQKDRYSYAITNMDGKLMLHCEGAAISGKIYETIDISSLPEGNYIFSIKSAKGFCSYKQFSKNQ
jgi:hypothetical protein